MTALDEKPPDCFGVLDRVFPMGEDGFRASPIVCMACDHKTNCLRTAMYGTEGLNVKEEKVDQAYESRSISFFRRWSEKKLIAKKRKQAGLKKG